MQPRLWSLTLGNFAIGTGVTIVPGMLNELSADLAIAPAKVGLLISVFALTICITGPFLAGWTSAIERRKLLTASLGLYALMHLVAAIAPGYNTLLAARMVTALGAAIFTSQAAATAGLMAPPGARGKAIGMVFLGWSIAAVAGTPVGAFLGAHIGWRPTFGIVALLSAAFAVAVWLQIPGKLFVAPINRAGWKSLFADMPLMLVVSVTAIQAVGLFGTFSYMALVLKDSLAATPARISLMFLCFGIAGVTGNVIGSRVMDRIGPLRVGIVAMSCMLFAILLWPLSRGSVGVTAMLLFVWGLGCFAVTGSQQVRLVAMAPTLASAAVSLNSSAIYLGQASGAFIGGVIVSTHGPANLSYFSAAPMAIAIAVSLLAARLATRKRLAAA